MNVIVANKYQSMLSTLNIEVIKSLYGEYEVEEIIKTFSNFFFQRMILDITAIKNYKDITNLQKLSMNLDMDKVILILDDSAESTSPYYLSGLVSMGIYNFTKNKEGIMYLYSHPNDYRDVAHMHQLKGPAPIPGQTMVDNNQNINVMQSNQPVQVSTKVIGLKNITEHAGSTTLTYMLKKQLEQNYNVSALQLGNDFMYFNDKSLISANPENLGSKLLKHNDKDVVLVDLGDNGNEDTCQEVLYLIEPSIIKLNKLLKGSRGVIDRLKNKKVVLNKSVLDSKDIMDFEYEARMKIFHNVPCLDDRDDSHEELASLLSKLGFVRGTKAQGEKSEKKSLFSIFKI
ncbi:MAG: hypothetical protein WDA21_04155 [Bacilli bacterium]